jgi:hypothetical protein
VPLIYITGPTAAGKSTVRNELMRRGYEAHDVDEDGIATWFNRESGEPAEYGEGGDMSLMSRERVEGLREQARGKPVFLCGIPGNALDMADLFDEVICLVIDEDTMLDRVATRTTNVFGRAPAERELILRNREPTIEAYRAFGALMVDGAQPSAPFSMKFLPSLRAKGHNRRRSRRDLRRMVRRLPEYSGMHPENER